MSAARITPIILTAAVSLACGASAAIIKGFRPGTATNSPVPPLLARPLPGVQPSIPFVNVPTNGANLPLVLFNPPVFTNNLMFAPGTNVYTLRLFPNGQVMTSPPSFTFPAIPLKNDIGEDFNRKDGSIVTASGIDPGMRVYGDRSHDHMPTYGDYSHDPMPGTHP